MGVLKVLRRNSRLKNKSVLSMRQAARKKLPVFLLRFRSGKLISRLRSGLQKGKQSPDNNKNLMDWVCRKMCLRWLEICMSNQKNLVITICRIAVGFVSL